MTKSSQLGPRHSRRSNCLGIPAITDQSIPSQIRCAGARPGQPPTTAAPPQLRHTTQEPGAQTAAPHSPDEPKCPNHVINKLSQLRLAPMRMHGIQPQSQPGAHMHMLAIATYSAARDRPELRVSWPFGQSCVSVESPQLIHEKPRCREE